MNLSEALDAALPEMPKTRLARTRPPRLDPDLVIREDVMDGTPFIGVLQRDKANFFRMDPEQWRLAQLFDGVRTYEEIAEAYEAETGAALAPADVRMFAETLEESDFWYKSPQEKNIRLNQKLLDQRGRRSGRKSKLNVSHISISGWDPDRYFNWLDRVAGGFIYSKWCVLSVVLLFLFEATVFIAKWKLIGPDIPLYYNFAHKSALDLLQFWMMFLILGFIHESGHGLTCKHYGGQVHSMGFMFLYLMPAFFVDVTEVWVSASKLQRLATIIAGIWIEMTVCGIAMIVWSNSVAGQWLHDFSYQVILITGLAVIVVNLNPLIKLDGYYFLTEVIGIPDLKERSTAFIAGWFQSRVLRLPVEMPAVPRKRAPFFILYAFASGFYSYMLLFFVIRFSYNITSKWFAEFAIIPAGALAFLLFRSRLRALRGVFEKLWEKNFGAESGHVPLKIAVGVALAVLIFLPLWRDREDAYFVVEPTHAETLHAGVPGRITSVLVKEGEAVHAGQPLLEIASPGAASLRSEASAEAGNARYRAVIPELHGQSIGSAAALENASDRSARLASEAQSSRTVTAPTDGIVLTRDPDSLLNQDVAAGQPLIDLAAAGPRSVRIYVPTAALDRIPAGAEVGLALPGRFSVVRMSLPQTGGDAVTLPAGIVPKQDYKGIKLPVFYSARAVLPASAGTPLFGESGQARIFGQRRSLAQGLLRVVMNLVKAHLW